MVDIDVWEISLLIMTGMIRIAQLTKSNGSFEPSYMQDTKCYNMLKS